MTEKRPGSDYLSDEADEAIREVLRNAMGRHATGKPLPKFKALFTEYEKDLFAVINNAILEHCGECPYDDAEDNYGEPVPWEELD